MIKLKHGVNPASLTTQILLAIIVARDLYAEHDYELVVTSLNDSDHAQTSRHYLGAGVDFRTRMMAAGTAKEITEELRKRLGRHYLVLFEHNHIHVGYQPRKP